LAKENNSDFPSPQGYGLFHPTPDIQRRVKMEPGIYLETKPITSNDPRNGKRTSIRDFKHGYLIYRKPDGTNEIIRGGRHETRQIIAVETRKNLEESKDAMRPGEPSRPFRKLPIPLDKADESWAKMRQQAEDIGKAGVTYDPLIPDFGGPEQTSNSVVRAGLDAVNVRLEEALPPGVKAIELPGIENGLKDGMEAAQKRSLMRNPIEGEMGGIPGEEAPSRKIKPPPPLERTLESPVSEWSEDDVRRVHGEAARRGAASPRGKALSGKVKEWYGHFYGNDPTPMDATGRMRNPRPIRPSPAGVGMGPVHVRAHSRSQDGTAVQVDAYSRSRPRP
jgi:hypothetical protein